MARYNGENQLAIEKARRAIDEAEHLYMIFSGATRHPFITYDAQNGTDRVTVYASMEKAQTAKGELERFGYSLMLADIPQAMRTKCFVDLHALGITQVVYSDGTETVLGLDMIRKLQAGKQQPHLNPALQLTSLYFLQEQYRQIEESQLTAEDVQVREELADAFAGNLAAAKYMIAIRMMKAGADKGGTRLSADSFDPVYMQDNQGGLWLPVFSDVTEFELFNEAGDLDATLLTLRQVRVVVGDRLKGAVLNPRSQSYRLMPEAIELLITNFPEEKQ